MMFPICQVVAFAILAAAALSDVAARTVSNALCVALALDGLIMAALRHTLPGSLLAAFAVLVVVAFIWRHGHLGGGDAKLMAASALLLPARHVPTLILAIAIAGGILGLVYALMMQLVPRPAFRGPTNRIARVLRAERFRIHHRYSLPYAVAISAGAVFTISHDAVGR